MSSKKSTPIGSPRGGGGSRRSNQGRASDRVEHDEEGRVKSTGSATRQGRAGTTRGQPEFHEDGVPALSPAPPGQRRGLGEGALGTAPPPSQPRGGADALTSRKKGMHEEDDDSAVPLKAPGPQRREATQFVSRPAQPPRPSGNTSSPQVGAVSVPGADTHAAVNTGSRGVGASSRNRNDPYTRVGAVAVAGVDVDNIPFGDDDTVVVGGPPNDGNSYMDGSGGTVVAEAVTSDDHIAQELRETLRSEIQRELQAQMRNQIVTAQVIATPSTSIATPSTQPTTNVVPSSLQDNYKDASSGGHDDDDEVKPFWKRKRFVIVALLAVLVIAGAAVVAVLFTTGNDDHHDNNAEQDAGGLVGGTQGPPIAPPPPGEPTSAPPSETPNLRPTVSPYVSLTSPQRLVGENTGDQFGEFVVLSRSAETLAVGAADGNYVRVYQRSNDGPWVQVGNTITGDGGGDQFGRCLDLNEDGSMLVVGAWNNDDAADNAGHAQVYRFDGTSWNKIGQTLTGDASADRFGWYVAMSDDGNTIAVSARLGDTSAGTDSGYVRVFTLNGNQWSQLGPDLEGDGSGIQFGRSIALDSAGRRIAVGANLGGDVGGGRVRVFDYSGVSWNRVGDVLDGENDQDWQGTSVAISADGKFLAVGSDGTDENGSDSGSVKVYRLDGTTWVRYDDGMILGEAAKDQFGASQISLSNDGTCLAVGANHHNNDGGKGYLYRYDGTQWTKIGEASGDGSGDRFGDAAAVSGDCQWAAWGAIGSSGGGDDYVDVYQVV